LCKNRFSRIKRCGKRRKGQKYTKKVKQRDQRSDFASASALEGILGEYDSCALRIVPMDKRLTEPPSVVYSWTECQRRLLFVDCSVNFSRFWTHFRRWWSD
jgi:hypothetical protein